jgi:hypothetical protein
MQHKKASRKIIRQLPVQLIVGPTPEGAISHFINFLGEAKNCFLEEKRRFIKN